MLSLDLTTIFFEILNFLVLAFLLYRFLFQPVLGKVQARAEEKERLARAMALDRAEIASTRAEIEERLAHLEEEGAAILTTVRTEAKEERALLLRQAQTEADDILAKAHLDARQWRAQAITNFHDDLLEAILAISRQAIQAVAPPELHDTLVRQLNERIWALGRSEIQRVEAIRQSLGDRTPTAYVTTAQPLSAEQQTMLARTFSALADRNVQLETRTDPSLTLGMRVRLGDIMIDNSLAGQLTELQETVSRSLKAEVLQEAAG
jgi:F-type H+-transporting ATPase subunit b